jgi:hypothetical protein
MIPRSPKAPGIAEVMMRPTSMTAKIRPRTRGVSGSNQLVTQQVYRQPSQTVNQRISVSMAPVILRLVRR